MARWIALFAEATEILEVSQRQGDAHLPDDRWQVRDLKQLSSRGLCFTSLAPCGVGATRQRPDLRFPFRVVRLGLPI